MQDGANALQESGRPGWVRGVVRSPGSLAGLIVLGLLALVSLGSLSFTLASAGRDSGGRALPARFKHGELDAYLIPPTWSSMTVEEAARLEGVARRRALEQDLSIANDLRGIQGERTRLEDLPAPARDAIQANMPVYLFGTDRLGRDVFTRCLTGGAVSIGIGLAAAAISVVIGTLYGAAAGYLGGRIDGLMMRIVDILYGLPYVLLVVLLAVAGDALIDTAVRRRAEAAEARRQQWITAEVQREARGNGQTLAPERAREMLGEDEELRRRLESEAARHPGLGSGEVPAGLRNGLEIGVLLVAIGGMSWLTMARVIRGQVLSLKSRPFVEAARALGAGRAWVFYRHLLPNLVGPIIVYATLTVPQAILQESFLSFLGIGVREPLPSWGSLASEGLVELNPVRVRWWLIVFPCALLGATLLSLNFVGEGLRQAFDPRRSRT